MPGHVDPLEYRQRAVVLTERQEPAERQPERPADERAIRSTVRDNGDRPARVSAGDRLDPIAISRSSGTTVGTSP